MGAAACDSLPVPPVRPGRPTLRLVPGGADVPTATKTGPRIRRARLAVALAVVAVAAVAVLWASGLTRAGSASQPVRRVVAVQAGQTLSHIAARELPELPVGTAVAEIQLANRLNTTQVHAGQHLLIPEVG
ncbi:MAG: LysM peptidoglycan-binding domain-containing protein [Dermatophilaceae bacterium]